MKKRCLSLLLTLCLLAALAVPAFAQEAEKQPTLQPASEHPSVLLNTPAVEVPAVRAEIEPMCVPHASMRSLSIARGYEGYLYYSLYRGTYSGTYGYSIEVYRGTSITEANYVGGYADGYTSADRICRCRGADSRARRRTCSPYKPPSKWQTLPNCHCEEAAGRRGNLAVPCWIIGQPRRIRKLLQSL